MDLTDAYHLLFAAGGVWTLVAAYQVTSGQEIIAAISVAAAALFFLAWTATYRRRLRGNATERHGEE